MKKRNTLVNGMIEIITGKLTADIVGVDLQGDMKIRISIMKANRLVRQLKVFCVIKI